VLGFRSSVYAGSHDCKWIGGPGGSAKGDEVCGLLSRSHFGAPAAGKARRAKRTGKLLAGGLVSRSRVVDDDECFW
jgi:hypothetical protein